MRVDSLSGAGIELARKKQIFIFPVGFPTLLSLPEASCPAFSYLELTLTFGSRSGIQNSRFQKRRLDRFYGNQEEEIIHS